MPTFVLIHGAGDVGWYWHLVAAELRAHGHEVIVPDLPCDDDTAGLNEYADSVVEAVGDRDDLVVVGQSFGAFTAPLVAARRPAGVLVLVAGMIPAPGESPVQWWENTGFWQEKREQPAGEDDYARYYHDVPREVAEEAMRRARPQSETRMDEPWPLRAWPDVPTKFVLCRQDRSFPPAFFRRVAAERLGITPDEIDAGHCVALSRPKELAEMLESYATEAQRANGM